MSAEAQWTKAELEHAAEIDEADRWLGRYRLCFEIASGGMATVFLARARGAAGFEKPLAVKRIHPHLVRERRFVEMFLDEARIAAQIDHSNVCTVFDFGETDGTYFMAMEYLVGEPLGSVLTAMNEREDRDDPHAFAFAVRIVAEAAEGLHAAHELRDGDGVLLGVVHRDVSPQNLFVTYDGHVKVVDFGIAYARNRIQQTRTGQLKGKLAYMAPEQFEDERVDRRADVWSLGVVAWEALTGKRLFRRQGEAATVRAVLGEPIPTPSSANPALPPALDAIVLRALDRDPERRFATARELASAISAVLSDRRINFGAPEVAGVMESLFPSGRAARRELVERAMEMTRDRRRPAAVPARRPAPGGRRRGRSSAFLFAAVVVAVIGFFSALGLGRGPTPPPPRDVETSDAPAPAPTPAPARAERPAAADEVADRALDAPRSDRAPPSDRGARRRRRPAPADEPARATGRVAISTPGGWATVYLRGERIGETPGVLSLPAGRHLLSVRPNDQAPYRRVRVRVRPDEVTRVRVDLRASE